MATAAEDGTIADDAVDYDLTEMTEDEIEALGAAPGANLPRIEWGELELTVRVRLPERHLKFATTVVARMRRKACENVRISPELVEDVAHPDAYKKTKHRLAKAEGPDIVLTAQDLGTLWDAATAWRGSESLDQDGRYEYLMETLSRATDAAYQTLIDRPE